MPGIGTLSVPATLLSVNSATRSLELGTVRIDSQGRRYVYVQPDTTLLSGYVVGLKGSTSANGTLFQVTPDISDCQIKSPVGVAVAVLSTSNFGWVQTTGPTTRVKTGTSVAAGDPLWWSADMLCRKIAGLGSEQAFGYARKADSGSILTLAYLNCSVI